MLPIAGQLALVMCIWLIVSTGSTAHAHALTQTRSRKLLQVAMESAMHPPPSPSPSAVEKTSKPDVKYANLELKRMTTIIVSHCDLTDERDVSMGACMLDPLEEVILEVVDINTALVSVIQYNHSDGATAIAFDGYKYSVSVRDGGNTPKVAGFVFGTAQDTDAVNECLANLADNKPCDPEEIYQLYGPGGKLPANSSMPLSQPHFIAFDNSTTAINGSMSAKEGEPLYLMTPDQMEGTPGSSFVFFFAYAGNVPATMAVHVQGMQPILTEPI